MQTASFAQDDFNLIDVYDNNGQTMTGAAVLGLPGDVWNPMNTTLNSISVVDAQGNYTPIVVSISGYYFDYNQPVDVSPITRNLLTGYFFGGTMTVAISGLIPNTNYLVINYMSGNTTGSGGTATWVDGAGVTNVGVAINNPLTTKSNFISGQNYTMLVGQSDSGGNIICNVTQSQQSPAIWNGMQLQEAPTFPVMYGLPTDQKVFVGQTAHFSSRNAGLPPLSFQWQFNGTNLTNGGGIAGATTPVLSYGNVSSSGLVSLILSNASGSVTNSGALTVVTPTPGSYAAAVNSDNPTAYWPLNEASGSSVAYEYINGYNGIVSNSVTMGAAGVPNPPYTGFPTPHTGAQFVVNDLNSAIAVPPLNLNANTATITAWIKPNGSQNPGAALLLTRSGTGGAGLTYGPAADELGYVWNGNSAGWNSGLTVPTNTWSFVALVIEPTKATLYVFNTSSNAAAINRVANSPEAWSGPAEIGADPADATGATNFNGVMDDVAVFPKAMSSVQVFSLYSAGLGGPAVAPAIIVQPHSKAVSKGAIAQFNAVAIGTGPINYQWQLDGTNLTDNGHITGSTTATLTVNNVDSADAGNYTLVVTGAVAPQATSSAATLAISPRPLLINIDILAGASPNYSGAAVIGQAGDEWNSFYGGSVPLVDYSGNPTTVTIGNSGGAFADDLTGGSPVTNAAALMRSYLYVNSGSATITISGLNTNAAYSIVTYNAGDQPGQGAGLGGALSGETLGAYRDPLAEGINYLVNSNVIPDSSGIVSFTVTNDPNYSTFAALNGLQIMRQDISGLAPLLGQQPADATNYAGLMQTFFVSAVSESPLSFHWMKGTSPLTDGGNISGATTPTLTLNPLQMSDAGTYMVVVTNANGSVSSGTATLTVLDGTYRLSWSPPVPITTPDATLMLPGQVVYAATFGGQSNGVDYVLTLTTGMTFDWTYNTNATVTGNGVNGNGNFSGSGNALFDQIMSLYSYDGGPKTITLNYLTPGLRYAVQLFGLDDRGGTLGLRQGYYTDPIVPTDKSATFLMQDNVYVVGTFLAANSTQDIIEQLPGNASGGDVGAGDMNALVLRLTPPNVSIVNNGNGTVAVSWDQTVGGTGPAHLESAPNLSGPWTDLGTSSPVTIPLSGTEFFRAVLP